jgi:hypothetical protein
VNSAWAMAGRSNDIKIDESHRVLNSPTSTDGKAFYVALIIGLLAARCGLVWTIINVSPLPFGLALGNLGSLIVKHSHGQSYLRPVMDGSAGCQAGPEQMRIDAVGRGLLTRGL